MIHPRIEANDFPFCDEPDCDMLARWRWLYVETSGEEEEVVNTVVWRPRCWRHAPEVLT